MGRDHGRSSPSDFRHIDPPTRMEALKSLLLDEELVSSDLLDTLPDAYRQHVGPHVGAEAVARAWVDEAYHERLLHDTYGALEALGYGGMHGYELQVLENTSDVHHVIVCTQCSCFAWLPLGLPPDWYKAPPYRSRIVREPRRTLRDAFGLDLSDDVHLHVQDVSAETRYFVLPRRPEGTEGWDQQRLAGLVTRNSMIGVERPQTPNATA